jgi:hypothetical protein
MRLGSSNGSSMTCSQLASPHFHQSLVDLWALLPNSAQMLVHSSQMDTQLDCHGRIGSARSICDERHRYAVLAAG